MKVIFRAMLLLIGLMLFLSIVKFLFVKVFFLALWVAAIAFLLYIVTAILNKA